MLYVSSSPAKTSEYLGQVWSWLVSITEYSLLAYTEPTKDIWLEADIYSFEEHLLLDLVFSLVLELLIISMYRYRTVMYEVLMYLYTDTTKWQIDG